MSQTPAPSGQPGQPERTCRACNLTESAITGRTEKARNLCWALLNAEEFIINGPDCLALTMLFEQGGGEPINFDDLQKGFDTLQKP